MKFLFACGGTAGHINPALAIAEELRKRVKDAKVLFVGADRELEKTLIPRAGFHQINIKMTGLRRGFSPKETIYNIKTAKNLIIADFKTSNLLKRFKPDVVIGTGGYICYPILKKAAKMKIPTIIHESNALPGLTTKLLSRNVDRVLVSFPDHNESYLKPERVILTGTPVREKFKIAANKFINEECDNVSRKPVVLSFWGSLGAKNMNEVIGDVMSLNLEHRSFSHIHAAGTKVGVDGIKKRLSLMGREELATSEVEISINEYIVDMPTEMARADLVICRGGGSTVAELIEMRKPAIIIPSPYVVNDEQKINSMELIKVGGAILFEEESINAEELYFVIKELLSDCDKLKRMSENLKSIAVKNAAGNIVDIILSLK